MSNWRPAQRRGSKGYEKREKSMALGVGLSLIQKDGRRPARESLRVSVCDLRSRDVT